MIEETVDRAVAAILRDPRSARPDFGDRAPSTRQRPWLGPARIAGRRTEFDPGATGDTIRAHGSSADAGGLTDLLDELGRGAQTAADVIRTAKSRAARWPAILVDLADETDLVDPNGRNEPNSHNGLNGLTDREDFKDPNAAAALHQHRTAGGTGRRDPAVGDQNSAGTALSGIPIAVKDNIDIAGLTTGMGGPVGRHLASSDAAAIRALRSAGAVPIGHTRMRELAWGVTTPGCPNPWRRGLSAGGSSGGSAAAVAAGIVPVALGTDTGGSIRIPAALCGVTGLRPTHGLARMDGIAAMSPALDTVGPLGLSAADCLWVHELIAGPGAQAPPHAAGLSIGVLQGWQGRVHPAVAAAVHAAAEELANAGARLVPIDLGSAGLAASVAYVLMLIDSARRYLPEAERQAGAVDAQVLEQLRQGDRIDRDRAVYPHALALAAAIRIDAERALDENRLAAVLSPVTAVPAVCSDAESVTVGDRTLPVADALSRYTALASLTGMPAMSVPAAMDDGLPVGVQLLGRPGGERTLALLAGVIEAGPGATVAQARRELWGAPDLDDT